MLKCAKDQPRKESADQLRQQHPPNGRIGLTASRRTWLLALPLLAALGGCAPAYWAWQPGCPTYEYCMPPPLPFTNYGDCHCPTPIASRWAQQHGPRAASRIEPLPPEAPEWRAAEPR